MTTAPLPEEAVTDAMIEAGIDACEAMRNSMALRDASAHPHDQPDYDEGDVMREIYLAMRDATQPTAMPERLWLWRNFVDGRPEYWAFDNPFPCEEGGGDPLTLGEPCGWAIFRPSTNGRPDVSWEAVEQGIASATAAAMPEEEVMRRAREACAKAEGAADLTASYLSGKYDLTIAVRAVALALRSLHIPLKPKVDEPVRAAIACLMPLAGDPEIAGIIDELSHAARLEDEK